VTWLLVAIIVAATTAGEILQAIAMRRHGEVRSFRPGALARAARLLARNRFMVLSILCMAVSFFAFMALLSVSDLSFAAPATAASYVLETALAAVVLQERVGARRWTGCIMVACGVGLLSL
jgi:uncharacterized membrane protein